MKASFILIFAAIFCCTNSALSAPRQEVLSGPLAGEVTQVLDGDTLAVNIQVWIGQKVETSLRIDGIDAPEIKGKCERERAMAAAARAELARLVADGQVRIYDVRLEKYAGRVLAKAETTDGINIAQHLLDKGFVRPYHGEKRQPWCKNL
jgi:micrococcal nuclease